MAILLTRPEPDNAATREMLRARGFDVVRAPLLQVQSLPWRIDPALRCRGVIATSANALRAIEGHAARDSLVGLPLFAVGARTADAARAAGFSQVINADGDAKALRKQIVASVKKGTAPLLYLAGADLSTDLAQQLEDDGIAVVTVTVYRVAMFDSLPTAAEKSFADHGIEAVLHYSRRSAQAFVQAVRGAGLEIAGLGVPQICLSEPIARVLREAGAARVVAASQPQEDVMLDLLERTLKRA